MLRSSMTVSSPLLLSALALAGFSVGAIAAQSTVNGEVTRAPERSEFSQPGVTFNSATSSNRPSASSRPVTTRTKQPATPSSASSSDDSPDAGAPPTPATAVGNSVPLAPQPPFSEPLQTVPPRPPAAPPSAVPEPRLGMSFAPLPPPSYEIDGGTVTFR